MTAATPPQRRRGWRVAQVALTAILIAGAGWKLWRQWSDASRTELRLEFQVGWLLAASAIVFVTYLLLVETWRRVLSSLGASIPFGTAARIWFAANLGKYLPFKIWTVSAMMVMTAEEGVPLSASGASAVIITIAQVASGFAVVLLTSLPTVQTLTGGTTGAIIVTAGMIASLVAAPVLARQWNCIAARLGRQQLSIDVPLRAVLPAIVGCGISWFMYGAAFQMLVRSLIGGGGAQASYGDYTAAYAASYLAGYLALFAPGGLGVRELALSALLPTLGIATQAQAALITVASRLWLTAVELIPSLFAATRTAAKAAKG